MRTLAISAIAVILAGGVGHSAQGPKGVVVLVLSTGYPGDEYTEPPMDGMRRVYFVGERIEANVVLENASDASSTLRSPGGIRSGLRWNDREQPLQANVELITGSLLRRTRAGDDPIRLDPGDAIALDPRDRLSLGIQLPAASFNPGPHILDFETDVVDHEGQPVVPYSRLLMFEVRKPSQFDQLELARRSALRAYAAGDYRTARRDVTRMLQLNSTSILAHVISGDIESAERAWAASASSYEIALQLLDSRSDKWLAQRYVEDFQWMHLREGIGRKLKLARARVG